MAVATGLSIGEVADRTGLSVHTLRFYESEGLFPEPVERVAGRRVFSEDQVEWLALCGILRASGMPLAALRDYAELVRNGAGNEPERLALLREHHDRVVRQMHELSRCLDLIAHKVGVYQDLSDGGLPHDVCVPPPRRA
jgi:DNA-binding transcriptional MerR regulator